MEPSTEALEELIESRREIKAVIEKLKADLDAIDNRLRTLGRGDHLLPSGSVIIVRPPNRVFNAVRASQLVDADTRIQAVQFTWDNKILKDALSPSQLQECMEPGTGQDRIVIQ